MMKKSLICFAAAAVVAGATPARADVQYIGNSAPGRPFSDAVRVDNMLILSGQIGVRADGTLPPSMEEQAKQTFENMSAVLKGQHLSLDDVVKCTVMLADMKKWDDFNKVYVTYFKPGHLPARSAIGANGLALGAQVEVECWAYVHK